MDPVKVLPPEICLRVLDFLSPEQLCRCLAVSHHWRQLANTDRLWHHFCKRRGINHQSYQPSAFGVLPLCKWAAVYISHLNVLVKNWRNSNYESFQLAKEDWCCCIANCKNTMAVYYPRSSIIQLFKISQTVDIVYNIPVALPNGLAIPDIFINEYFIVLSRGNVVLIYKNNEEYPLDKVIVSNEYGLSIANDIFPFAENNRRLYVKAVSKETIWIESDALFVVNNSSNTYRILSDSFRCLRFDGEHIFAANSVVSCYNLQGDREFSLDIHCVEDMWVKDDIVVVLVEEDWQHLEVWSIRTKSMLNSIAVLKDPCVSIGSESDCIFILEIVGDSISVSCISTKASSLVWKYENVFQRELVIHPEIRFICDRFIFVRPSHTCDKNFLLIDSKNGRVLYDCTMPPCLNPPCYIYHLSDEFFITAESNLIHIRSYI